MINRIKYHAMRFNTAMWYGGGTLFVFMFLMLVAYPNDDETVASFIGLLGEIGLDSLIGLDVDAPGFTLWIVLFAGSYLFMILAVVGIRMGARVLPTTEEDGMELLLGSQPNSARKTLFENWLGAQFALFIVMLPTWGAMVIFAIIFGAADIIGRLFLMGLFFYVVTTFFLTFTMVISVMTFSKSWGLRGGFFYFIYAIIILFSAGALNRLIADNMPEDLDLELDVAVLNVSLALDPGSTLVTNELNWTEFSVVLALSAIFVLVSIWRVKSPDFIEKVGQSRDIRRFLPTLDRTGYFKRRFPLMMEQLQRDKSFLLIYIGIIVFLFPYEMVLFWAVYGDDPTAFAELINGFDVGLFNVLLGGHPIPGTYVGFSVTQFFALSWLYYGLHTFIIGMNIANRDVNTNAQDFLYGTPVTQRRVILARTAAMLISHFVLVLSAVVANIIFGEVFGLERDIGNELAVFTVAWLSTAALGLFVIAVTMIPRVSSGKRLGFWFFMFTVLTFFFGNLLEDLSFLGYFSVINYFDYAGIVLEIAEIGEQLLIGVGMVALATFVFFVSLLRYERKDLI